MTTAVDHLDLILSARRPFEVFGALEGPVEDRLDDLRRTFRRLARATHPDRQQEADRARAGDAMANLSRLYQRARELVAAGEYDARAAGAEPVIVRARGKTYEITDVEYTGDACRVYSATYDDGAGPALVKVVARPGDNDLLANEAKVLAALLKTDAGKEHGAFLPQYLEAFRIRSGGKTRQAIAYERGPRLYSLDEVRARYPDGVHPKDAAWMFRRLLFALGVAHEAGYVHGAILPRHVLIQPEEHGLVLIDWKYALKAGGTIRSIPAGTRGAYPPEVTAKEPAGPAVDVYMAAGVLAYLLGYAGDGDAEAPRSVPTPLRGFIRGCRLERPKMRPQHGWALLEEFDDLIERLWGARRFHPFTM